MGEAEAGRKTGLSSYRAQQRYEIYQWFFDITAKLVTRKKKVQTLLETEDFEKFIGELVPM